MKIQAGSPGLVPTNYRRGGVCILTDRYDLLMIGNMREPFFFAPELYMF
jgi:hypothetical protein